MDAKLILKICEEVEITASWRKHRNPSVSLRVAYALGLVHNTHRRYDVNLFLERLHYKYFPMAKRNVLIPNPEWFPIYRMESLPGIDVVLCKTFDAMRIFEKLGKDTRYIGFTSKDVYRNSLAACHEVRALHIAGQSPSKGTKSLLRVWRKHPEWPTLTILQRPSPVNSDLDTTESTNIRMLHGRIPEVHLLEMIRAHSVYILPSVVEGYGQSLVEGMSAGAVVITTNGAPMNEIVSEGRGVLVNVAKTEPMSLGMRHYVDELDLERKIANVLTWSKQQRMVTGAAAREWYLENDKSFRHRFVESIRDIIDNG